MKKTNPLAMTKNSKKQNKLKIFFESYLCDLTKRQNEDPKNDNTIPRYTKTFNNPACPKNCSLNMKGNTKKPIMMK